MMSLSSRRRWELIIVRCVQAALDAIVGVILWLVMRPQKGKLPDITDPLLLLSVVELAAAIRNRKLSSESVVQSYTRRILSVDPLINAVVDQRFQEALREAREVDLYLRTSGRSSEELAKDKPLLGVPVSIKSNIACKGMKHECGLVARRDVRATEDAETVRLLRRAGAVVLVTTNVPELSTSYRAYNKLNGHTKNPHDLARTSGGSTGGESALICSGASLVGLGNDMCGSLRMPACVTGLFAHKTTSGVVSTSGLYPPLEGFTRQMLVQGPMCRYAEDLAPVLEILAGHNASKLQLHQKVDFKKLTFYYVGSDMEMNYIPAKENSKKSVRKVLSYFQRTHGAAVKQISLPLLKDAIEMGGSRCKATSTRPYVSYMADHPEREITLWKELVKYPLGLSNHTADSLLFAALEAHTPVKGSRLSGHWDKQLQKLSSQMDDLLQEDCVLVHPSCPETALYPFEAVSKFLIMQYYVPFNVLGLPVTQCPVGLSGDGYPSGVQVVAGKHRDRVTLAVARELELAFGGWCKPCQVAVKGDLLGDVVVDPVDVLFKEVIDSDDVIGDVEKKEFPIEKNNDTSLNIQVTVNRATSVKTI